MRLNDDDFHDVLARAEEIQRTSLTGPAGRAEIEVLIQAAEAVGIPRAAVERALRERFGLPAQPVQVGERVFAPSADGNFYVAEVLEAMSDRVRVRFLRGGETTLTADQLQPCAFLPGEKVTVQWPWWGPWAGTVVSYDATKEKVKVTDGWGETRKFPVAEVWRTPPRLPTTGAWRKHLVTSLGVAGAGLGIMTLLGLLIRLFG